jgi:hypothetical protein
MGIKGVTRADTFTTSFAAAVQHTTLDVFQDIGYSPIVLENVTVTAMQYYSAAEALKALKSSTLSGALAYLQVSYGNSSLTSWEIGHKFKLSFKFKMQQYGYPGIGNATIIGNVTKSFPVTTSFYGGSFYGYYGGGSFSYGGTSSYGATSYGSSSSASYGATTYYAATYSPPEPVAVATDDGARGQNNDNFQPSVPVLVDTGDIFAVAYMAAKRLNDDKAEGDNYLPGKAYNLIIDTVLNNGSFNFASICSGKPDAKTGVAVPAGCAMMAMTFYGASNRAISDYYLTPGTTIAFTDTVYQEKAFEGMISKPPTSLVQVNITSVQCSFKCSTD